MWQYKIFLEHPETYGDSTDNFSSDLNHLMYFAIYYDLKVGPIIVL